MSIFNNINFGLLNSRSLSYGGFKVVNLKPVNTGGEKVPVFTGRARGLSTGPVNTARVSRPWMAELLLLKASSQFTRAVFTGRVFTKRVYKKLLKSNDKYFIMVWDGSKTSVFWWRSEFVYRFWIIKNFWTLGDRIWRTMKLCSNGQAVPF